VSVRYLGLELGSSRGFTEVVILAQSVRPEHLLVRQRITGGHFAIP